MMPDNFLIYGAALGAGALGALAVAVLGRRWSLLDRPNERSSHERDTPRGGGIGILAAFLFCSILCAAPLYFWLPAVLLALISFCGDRFEVSVSVRLPVQFFLAACFLIFMMGPNLPDADVIRILPLFLFYLVFVVGTANFYNFMDGINGIAGITGVVAFGLLGCYGSLSGKEPGLVTLSFGVMAACAGFLPFNAPRARVFMGDVGSILLGFVFAGLAALLAASATEFVLLAGFLFPFYADELVTMAERLRDRESLTQAHRRHLYQVLANEGGVAHWRVAAGYGLAQLLVGLVVWKAGNGGLIAPAGILTLFSIAFILVNNRIKRRYRTGVS